MKIIPKTHVSSREGINSRCRCFYLLLFAVLAQPVAAMTTVVAVQVVAVMTGRWRSTVTAVIAAHVVAVVAGRWQTAVAVSFKLTLARRLGFRECWMFFAYKTFARPN